MWHPNIYEVSLLLQGAGWGGGRVDGSLMGAEPPRATQTGDVCISILHPPVDDPQSGELPSERWNPTQNVR